MIGSTVAKLWTADGHGVRVSSRHGEAWQSLAAGFDPVVVGPLVRGREFEPDTTAYNTGMSGSELRALFSRTAG
jgi:predicted dinucleotide-binding enzyme